jgi:hypothetical protein
VPFTCAGQERACDATPIWTCLGVPARTALDLVVVAPVVPPLATELAPAVRSISLGARRDPDGVRTDGAQTYGTRTAKPEHRITEA